MLCLRGRGTRAFLYQRLYGARDVRGNVFIMSAFEAVQLFVSEAKHVSDLSTLNWLLDEVTQDLGFDYFALVHALDRRSLLMSAAPLTNFPAAWQGTFQERAYWADDPVMAACQRADAGFLWSDLPKIIRMSDRQQSILLAARREGLHGGFTVPIPKRGTEMSLCSFAVNSDREIAGAMTAAAQAVGWFAFQAARRLTRLQRNRTEEEGIRLTSRQLDCLVLYAKGKSDAVIGQLLGLSRRTVNEYMENAKRRHMVATRQQLLGNCLWSGQLLFEDVLD